MCCCWSVPSKQRAIACSLLDSDSQRCVSGDGAVEDQSRLDVDCVADGGLVVNQTQVGIGVDCESVRSVGVFRADSRPRESQRDVASIIIGEDLERLLAAEEIIVVGVVDVCPGW